MAENKTQKQNNTQEQNNAVDNFMTAQEVADLLKVNLNSVRRWSRTGKLKGYKLGGSGDWRYVRPEVIDFVRGSHN